MTNKEYDVEKDIEQATKSLLTFGKFYAWCIIIVYGLPILAIVAFFLVAIVQGILTGIASHF